ncbi:E1-E2 ATPase-domain-containing protein [Coprinopsis sp. MPI-PUGE-AT-0042]|nr:E1-E2 ATPase-domain-containing protein [Coprinopsis sp. MPI-PUGE-AT-0042]
MRIRLGFDQKSFGITIREAERRLELCGPNKLECEEQNTLLQVFLVLDVEPPVMGHGARRSCRYRPLLLIANSAFGCYEERNTGNAVKALMDSLAPKGKAHRDNTWQEIKSTILVPGDIIAFKIGDIVPADCRLTKAINACIDQAALTSESLPINKKTRDQCFSSSTGKNGEANGAVISTGANTFFGRVASLVSQDDTTTGHFTGLDNILVHLIVGIPIAMSTVLSISLAVGAQQLAK